MTDQPATSNGERQTTNNERAGRVDVAGGDVSISGRRLVFLKPEVWELIDGEALFVQLAELAEVLPQIAEVQVGPVRLIVADYQVWKEKVRRRQAQEVTNG